MATRFIVVATVLLVSVTVSAQQLEYCNNFLMNYSFITGTDRGMEQNLDDNLTWMTDQGYTHLRFFGIFPNGVHCFPSHTLDSNGWPSSAYHEQTLALLMQKAQQHGIVVNFDGWEIIAESNYDTTKLGVGYITEEELGAILLEVLSFGYTLISEEQFEYSYLQTIQSVTTLMGATHETTTAFWYQSSQAASIADAQLASVFCFYPRDLFEADSIIAAGHGYDIPATLGGIHPFMESPKFFNIPISLAVGSFGTICTENWKNVLFFAQLQHHPGRVSIEEVNHNFLINSSFNFMDYAGYELSEFESQSFGERPLVNLVYNIESVYSESFIPTWFASLVNNSAIANTFTTMGYRVVATVDSVLPGASAYYLLLTGGADEPDIAPLPEYVLPLLADTIPCFIHPTFGIPDVNDAMDWLPLRDHFGLPSIETQTLTDAIPETVTYKDYELHWGGISLYLTPALEYLPVSLVDNSVASVPLSGMVSAQDVALIIQNGKSWLINSNVFHHEASFVLSDLLGGPLNRPVGADIVVANGIGMIFAEYNTEVDLDIPWLGETRITKYDSNGDITSDAVSDLGGLFTAALTRGELYVLRDNLPDCCIGVRGNANGDPSEGVNISDITFLINYLFGVPLGPPPPCPEEGNANGDGDEQTNISDITYLVDYLFGVPLGPAPPPCP